VGFSIDERELSTKIKPALKAKGGLKLTKIKGIRYQSFFQSREKRNLTPRSWIGTARSGEKSNAVELGMDYRSSDAENVSTTFRKRQKEGNYIWWAPTPKNDPVEKGKKKRVRRAGRTWTRESDWKSFLTHKKGQEKTYGPRKS